MYNFELQLKKEGKLSSEVEQQRLALQGALQEKSPDSGELKDPKLLTTCRFGATP